METSLHRELKSLYAAGEASTETSLDQFRIDAVDGDELIEVQYSSLAAIAGKVSRLLRRYAVTVVKPIVVRKQLVKTRRPGGDLMYRRMSPKRGCALDLFDELVYFMRVFPHRRLTLEVALVDVEEWRFPGHGKRRRRRASDYQVEDCKLLRVRGTLRLQSASDLRQFAPAGLPKLFHTGHLADGLQVRRHVAQQVAYCFREAGTTRQVSKQGNTLLYEFVD